MIRIRVLLAAAATLAACSLLAGTALLAQAPPQPTPLPATGFPSETAAPGDLTATLWGVDIKAREVRLITGVGHALRIVRVSLEEGCQIRHAGAAGRLEDLRPGGIVRVRYRGAGERVAAQSIDTVAPERAGGAP